MNLSRFSRIVLLVLLISESTAIQVTNSDAAPRNSNPVKRKGDKTVAINERVLDHEDAGKGLKRAGVAHNRSGFQARMRHPRHSTVPVKINQSGSLYSVSISKHQLNATAKQVPETAVAATAVALGAAAAHRAIITGRDMMKTILAHGNPFDLDRLLKPAHRMQQSGTAAQRQAALDAAADATVASTVAFNGKEVDVWRSDPGALDPNVSASDNGSQEFHDTTKKKAKEHDATHEASTESSEAHFSPAAESVASASSDADQQQDEDVDADETLWPATDVLPVQNENDEDNGTVLTPRPLVWEQTQRPPEPVLFMPLVVFAVGLIGLFCMFITSDGPPFGATSSNAAAPNDRSRGVNMHTKVDAIFQAADQDRDGFVSFPEMARIARLSNPRGTSLTREWFCDLCRPIGADPQRGLDRTEFCRSYQLLGIDVDKEYDIIQQIVDLQATACGSPADSNDTSCAAGQLLEQLTPGGGRSSSCAAGQLPEQLTPSSNT